MRTTMLVILAIMIGSLLSIPLLQYYAGGGSGAGGGVMP